MLRRNGQNIQKTSLLPFPLCFVFHFFEKETKLSFEVAERYGPKYENDSGHQRSSQKPTLIWVNIQKIRKNKQINKIKKSQPIIFSPFKNPVISSPQRMPLTTLNEKNLIFPLNIVLNTNYSKFSLTLPAKHQEKPKIKK